MLMRTDPFRELDRVAQQVLGTAARPAAMPIDAYRKGDEFVVLVRPSWPAMPDVDQPDRRAQRADRARRAAAAPTTTTSSC